MLFKTIDQIKEYFSFLAQSDVKFLKPHIIRAENKYMRKYLGSEFYITLNDYVADNGETDETLEDLLEVLRPALGAFAVKDAVSQLNLVLTDSGFAVTESTGLAPASKQRTDDLKAELEESAWDGIEAMLQFLEENKENYAEWVASDGYTQAHRNLINSAVEFFDLVNLETSRLMFSRLRAIMDNVETLVIAKEISSELLDEIKEQIEDDSVSDDNDAILPDLKRALANLTIAAHVPEEKSENQSVADKYNINAERRKQYEQTGVSYLARAIKTIKDTPDNFPAYEESALYTAPVAPFENLEENPTFIMGG